MVEVLLDRLVTVVVERLVTTGILSLRDLRTVRLVIVRFIRRRIGGARVRVRVLLPRLLRAAA